MILRAAIFLSFLSHFVLSKESKTETKITTTPKPRNQMTYELLFPYNGDTSDLRPPVGDRNSILADFPLNVHVKLNEGTYVASDVLEQ